MKKKIKFRILMVIISLFVVGVTTPKVDAASQKQARTTKTTKAKQSTTSSSSPYSKFAGTYSFPGKKKGGRFNNNPIVVLSDGRCIVPYMTLGGEISPKFIGNISPISNTAFRITGTNKKFFYDMDWYDSQTGEWGERTTHGFYVSNAVFEKAEGKVYKSYEDYKNRDIVKYYYTPMTYSKSTSY